MSSKGIRPLPEFNPTDSSAPEWELYKRDFQIHLDAFGLDDKPGRRKVGVLLANMGRECVKIYDAFEWAPEIVADEPHGIVGKPAEDRYDLDTVFAKFDRHFGVHNYRNIKRQEFLNTKRGSMSIMDFISELKRKAEHCQYGEQKEGLICDMVINGVKDKKCSEKLMEIPADQLNIDRVVQVCRQVELTTAHLKTLEENPNVNMAKTSHSYQGNKTQTNYSNCPKCCRRHEYRNCPAFNKTCDTCGVSGHFKASRLCRGTVPRRRMVHNSARGRGWRPPYRGRGTRRRVNYAETGENEELNEMFTQSASISDVFIAKADASDNQEWTVTLKVGNEDLNLEIDSGAMCNVMSKRIAEKFQRVAQITQSDTIINGVSGKPIKAQGKIVLPCVYKGTNRNVEFQVMDTPRNVNLLGRNESVKFGLIMRVNTVKMESDAIIKEYSDVLGEEIGCLPGEYEIKLDKSVQPVVHAPRPVPVAIRDQLKIELDHLERCGIIKQEKEPTRWVNSMVCVRKKNGRVRICIDPIDLNKAIMREHYPMRTIDDVATRLHGSKFFTTLDANMGYYQIKLAEESSLLTTFNTPFGRYRYLRMPMGAKCASEVFQREMETHFGCMNGAEVIVDDILVHGKTLEEHNARLKSVLEKARTINLKLNIKKCVFAQPEVDYVGHKLTGEGIKPTDQRIAAIINMRDPENHSELETILGMLSYVSKFIPCLSELNAPLRDLKKEETWNWNDSAKQAFMKIKSTLVSTKVLRYYDLNKLVTLTVDASMRGLGAAIIQEDGVVAYASRALSPTEQKYAQIEKEMLAVVFGCEKFHKLLYGRQNFTVESDHKPLESILKKAIHKAPLRIQRMMLKLQPYEFTLVHKSGKEMGLADCLSRLPLDEIGTKTIDEELMVFKTDTLSCTNHDKIAGLTQGDEQFQVLAKVISRGWPETKSELPVEAIPFWDYRDEMAVYNGVLYRGDRVCIPAEMRTETLKAIHSSHLGIVNCKKRARELVFWPGMNKQIEDLVSKCSACLMQRNKQAKEPMIIQPIPELPWSKVGMDLCEHEGYHYLIMVDYYSNFIEVAPLQRDTRTSTLLKHIKQNVARYGIMDTIMSDNGPQFTSSEFKDFTEKYGIRHITSSPLHQQANGLAEKAVQTVKNLIKKCAESGDDIYLSLLELRNTPRDNEIGSPMQRLMSRRAKTLIPIAQKLRKPESSSGENVASKLLDYREKQKFYYDQHAKVKDDLQPGDAVRINSPSGWKPAEYVRKSEHPRSHIVKAGETGREYRRNTDKILKTRETPHIISGNDNVEIPFAPVESAVDRSISPRERASGENASVENASANKDKPIQPNPEKTAIEKAQMQENSVRKKTRFGRELRRPKRLIENV